MTLELQQTLEREMEDALKIEDPSRRADAVLTVVSHQIRALVDCQRKTSDRVKKIVSSMAIIKVLWTIAGALGGLVMSGITIYSMLRGAAA